MNGYWLKFTDGTSGYCQGVTDYDAKIIAEKVSGKTLSNIAAKPLPYPASPVIWQLDHPVYGKTPTICFSPEKCQGKTACPQRYSCTE